MKLKPNDVAILAPYLVSDTYYYPTILVKGVNSVSK